MVDQIVRQQLVGYQLAYLESDRAIRSVAGFRYKTWRTANSCMSTTLLPTVMTALKDSVSFCLIGLLPPPESGAVSF